MQWLPHETPAVTLPQMNTWLRWFSTSFCALSAASTSWAQPADSTAPQQGLASEPLATPPSGAAAGNQPPPAEQVEPSPLDAPAPAPVAPAPAPVAQAPAAEAPPIAAPAAPPLTREQLRAMPKRLRYDADQPVPDGYTLHEGTVKGLWIPGLIMVGVPYFSGLFIASLSDFDNEGGWLAIPVAGPWITLATRRDCSRDEAGWDAPATGCDSADANVNSLVRTSLILDGLIQTAGLAMTIAGLSITRRQLIRNDLAEVWIAPGSLSAGAYGAHLFGRF